MTTEALVATWFGRVFEVCILLMVGLLIVAALHDWRQQKQRRREDVRVARATVAEWMAEVRATETEPLAAVALADLWLHELEIGQDKR